MGLTMVKGWEIKIGWGVKEFGWVRNGKGIGRRRRSWIWRGGRVGMSNGISPNEDKSKEKSDQDR